MQDPKYKQVADSILERIKNGEWKPGDKIPSERNLVEIFDVSRITIKKAVEILVYERRLTRPAGRNGTFVSESSNSIVPDRSNIVGVAIDDISDRFGSTILRGIEDVLWQNKVHTVICNSDRDFQKVRDYFESLLEKQIDGIIFAPVIVEDEPAEKNRQIISMIKKHNKPYVLLDRTVENSEASFVTTDHRESSEAMTAAMISAGCRRLLLLKGIECSSMTEREQGFLDAVRTAEIAPAQIRILNLNDNKFHNEMDPAEVDRISEAMASFPDPDGIITLNNRLLKGLLKASENAGTYLSEKIALGVHDKVSGDIAGRSNLFNIIQPDYELGREAARLLLQCISEPDFTGRKVILKSRLVVPDSGQSYRP